MSTQINVGIDALLGRYSTELGNALHRAIMAESQVEALQHQVEALQHQVAAQAASLESQEPPRVPAG